MTYPNGQGETKMKEKISVEFGELVSEIVGEIGMLESELLLDQIGDTSYVRGHYQAGVVNMLRRFFDEVEERDRHQAEKEKREKLQAEELKQDFMEILKEPETLDLIQERLGTIFKLRTES